MPHGRGNKRGYMPGPLRGRARGRTSGRGPRGSFRLRPNEAHRNSDGNLVFDGDFEDFNLDHIMLPGPHRGGGPVQGRGGYQGPRGRGGMRGRKTLRGIGFSDGLPRPPVLLSTLERDRPLLRPVIFVRGEYQKTLFEEVEELLCAHGEEGEVLEDHAPSADIVERIFYGEEPTLNVIPNLDTDSTSGSGSDGDGRPAVERPAPLFTVDTAPSPVVFPPEPLGDVHQAPVEATPLGETVDDEVIVYVAPHPRATRRDPAVPSRPLTPSNSLLRTPAIDSSTLAISSPQPMVSTPIDLVPISFTSLVDPDEVLSRQVNTREKVGLKPTPRSRKMAKKERAATRRRQKRHAMLRLTSIGLSMEERAALQEESTIKTDPRYAERRKGDSDIDWGTDGEGEIEEMQNGIGDMDLDGEVGDIEVLTRFAHGMEGLAGEVVTIADLEDAAKMRLEDNDQDSNGKISDQDHEVEFDVEERREIGESADTDDLDSSDDETPRRSFQGRLKRLREKAKGKPVVDVYSSSNGEDTEEENAFEPNFSWADKDEAFLDNIDDLLAGNQLLLRRGDRKVRNRLFKRIQNGDLEDDYEDLISLNQGKKNRDIPSQLQDQWERDRAKKAERKRSRALARRAAADASPTPKSTKKKQKIFGGARFHGDTLYADHVHNIPLLERLIRDFLGNLELKNMVLPPKSKDFRKRAHLMAEAFNLKSKSKGKGEGRFTTLIKTTRSGISVDEGKITRLVNGNKGEDIHTPTRASKIVRHRDGDEVGKMAPKLSHSNVGFKILQQMGWEEGGRIGATGGLTVPLTAIIKTTKLGLGASRQ